MGFITSVGSMATQILKNIVAMYTISSAQVKL